MKRIIVGDSAVVLATLAANSVNCCVTSPPYWGLRDYGMAGQIGLESTPEEYAAKLVSVFREVRRVLRDDGTVWLNLGDSYAGSGKGGNPQNSEYQKQRTNVGSIFLVGQSARDAAVSNVSRRLSSALHGIKPKDLIGTPWLVAFALRADGWYLRSEIIWAKPNPMPESVTDRPTKAHEQIFLLSKSAQYWYDATAIREESVCGEIDSAKGSLFTSGKTGAARRRGQKPRAPLYDGRNARSVWNVATQPFSGAHFATFPPKLAERCILAGCPQGGMVLDPFAGAGTAGLVANRLGRDFIGIELNPEYVGIANDRIYDDAPLFNELTEA